MPQTAIRSRAGKSLAGLPHLDPDARVLPHIHSRASHHLWVVSGSCTTEQEAASSHRHVVPMTAEQQAWAAAAELAGRWDPKAEAS
jgi:hypothetical protein